MKHLPEGPEYKPVPSCPDYMAGSDGTVWTTLSSGRWPQHTGSWRQLKGYSTNKSGHLRVKMRTTSGFPVVEFLHRVILTTFVGPCPDGSIGCHDPDPNPANCAVDNLRWGTPSANVADCRRHGRLANGERMPQSKLVADDVVNIFRLRKAGLTHQAIANRVGVPRPRVTKVLQRKVWRHVPVDEEHGVQRATGQHAKGESHCNSKLTESSVKELRRLASTGVAQRVLATRYGVSQGTISDIVRRKMWAHT